MRSLIALTALAIATVAPIGTAAASADSLTFGTDGRVAETDCPKGTIKTTDSDGKVRCAKITIVSPTAPGF